METQIKTCGGCKKDLSLTLFKSSTKNVSGYMSQCISCSKKARTNYHKNKNSHFRPNIHCIICAEKEIFKNATFGYINDNKRTHCSAHRFPEMINLVDKNRKCIICAEKGIFRNATFGYINDTKRTHCAEHHLPEMIDLANKNKKCISCAKDGIFIQASFGYISDNKRTHCAEHRLSEMIDLANKNNSCIICSEKGIFIQASFGYINDNKITHCAEHRLPEMIDLKHKNNGCIICAEKGIFKNSTFGYINDGKITHCAEHRLPEMIDLKHKNNGCIICSEKGIFIKASFGYINDNKMTHCAKHRLSEMIDLINKNNGCIICSEQGIFKIAVFGDNKKTHCAKHRLPEMIDLAHKNNYCIICSEKGIFKRATFGKLFEKKIHCAVHKLNNEYSVNNPKCEKCLENPCYGTSTDIIPKRCEKHQTTGDIDMIRKECYICHEFVFLQNNKDICIYCSNNSIIITKSRKLKENRVGRCLIQLSSILEIQEPIQDNQIENSCTRRRPDFYYLNFKPQFSLIVEVDEHQHSRYSCSINGEFIRIINLYEEGTQGIPIVLIRFNPDEYYYNKKVISTYKGREDKLCQVIKSLKNEERMLNPITIIYLFYDNFENIVKVPFQYKYKNGELIVYHKHPHSNETKHIIKTV